MVTIPPNVNEWSRGLLIDLLEEGYDENNFLEFKSKINTETKKIPITACAFANTTGGFLVFGIDNDKGKKKTMEDRLIGLEDSDQLKSQINNQLQNIRPNISIEDIIFRDANIRLPDGNVIVILKVEKSRVGPHQYDHIFYKRGPNGNIPMEIDEIKEAILHSKKSENMLTMLSNEGANLIDTLKGIQILFENRKFERAFLQINNIVYDSFIHFVYHFSYLYNDKIQDASYVLMAELNRLIRNNNQTERLKMKDLSDTTLQLFITNVKNCIENLENLKNGLRIDFVEIINSLEKDVSQEMKEEMAKKIKEIKKQEINSINPKTVST